MEPINIDKHTVTSVVKANDFFKKSKVTAAAIAIAMAPAILMAITNAVTVACGLARYNWLQMAGGFVVCFMLTLLVSSLAFKFIVITWNRAAWRYDKAALMFSGAMSVATVWAIYAAQV